MKTLDGKVAKAFTELSKSQHQCSLVDRSLAKSIEQIEEIKNLLELAKTVYCFLDGNGKKYQYFNNF